MAESQLMQFFETLLLGPLVYVTIPSQRLYFLSLICSGVISLVYYKYCRKMKRGCLKFLFSLKLFKSPSSLFDVKIFYLNFWITKALGLGGLGLGFGIAASLGTALEVLWPDPITRRVPSWVAAVTYTLALFLFEDFSRYWVHKQFHRYPFLWRFHQTHHSAEVLTPLTLHRVHPVEVIVGKLRHALCFGLLSGLALYLFKDNFSSLTILGVEAIGFIFNLCGANLRHSHVFLGYGKVEKFCISPAQHQIHHSRYEEHFDKNFGVALALWDRLGGSWLPSCAVKKLQFGVDNNSTSHTIKQQILEPFFPVEKS